MPGTYHYLFRADRGGQDDRFDAVSDAAACDYVRELLYDEGAEDGDGGCLYRLDDPDRGVETFIAEVRLGDDEEGNE